MSTLTPNYELIVPDDTDTVEQVRADYATNLGKIDNITGGGGSSTLAGLTDVSLSSPTNGQVLGYNSVSQKWENVNGGGGGGDTYNVYGAFIDTNRVITSGSYSLSLSYTATEDCFFYTAVALNNNTGGSCAVDGETVSSWWNGSGGTVAEGIGIYLKRGQTFTATATNSSSSGYSVYGLTQGTNQVGHNYSTSEQVIGTFIDGKPIYERSWDFSGSPITINSNSWRSTGIIPTDIKRIIGVEGINPDGTCWGFLSASCAESTIELLNIRNTAIVVSYLTLRYQKTTD